MSPVTVRSGIPHFFLYDIFPFWRDLSGSLWSGLETAGGRGWNDRYPARKYHGTRLLFLTRPLSVGLLLRPMLYSSEEGG
jgi:hypothetical protein